MCKKKVYIAGALNADACGYIKNLHKMIKWSEQVRRLGFTVFVPGLDFLVGIVMGDMDYKDYFENNQLWLDASDIVFVTPGWETSSGTKKEIERAIKQGIPVCYELDELKYYL